MGEVTAEIGGMSREVIMEKVRTTFTGAMLTEGRTVMASTFGFFSKNLVNLFTPLSNFAGLL